MKRNSNKSLFQNCSQNRQKQQGSSAFNQLQVLYYDFVSQLQVADFRAIASIVVGSIYFAITNSSTVYLLLTCFLIAAAIKIGFDFFPGLRIKLKPWHILGLALSITAVVSLESPATAQFFNSLEEAVSEVVSEGETGIDESIIATLFTFFRVIVILSFVIGVVVVLAQAFRGNDWAPIANMLGVGIAFVIVIELITNLMLGGE